MECEKKIIYSYAKQHGNVINWGIINERFITLDDYYSYLDDNILNVVLFENFDGMGGTAGDIANYLSILQIALQIIIFIFKKICIIIKPYSYLNKEINRDKEFVNGVILKSKKWKCNFISNRNFKNKETIEKVVMKRLKYKKINGYWITDKNNYKLPSEIH